MARAVPPVAVMASATALAPPPVSPSPAVRVVNQTATTIHLSVTGITTGAGQPPINLILGESNNAGWQATVIGGGTLGHAIVLNALDLSRHLVRNVMRPRQEITAFDTEAGINECLEIAEKTRYSRFPLCQGGDLDKSIGVVHIKDLFASVSKMARAADLARVARKLIYVPETTRLEKLLQLFLERKLHFAIVVDEYGGTLGMVTLENVLEELVGQIQDEFDQEKPLLLRRGENHWEIDGALPLHELAELVGQDLSGDGISTTSGWVTQRLGGFPKRGDLLRLGQYELRVEETDGARVARLQLKRTSLPE